MAHLKRHDINSTTDHAAGTASTVLGTNVGGTNIVEIVYSDSTTVAGELPIRDANGDLLVPLTPTTAAAAASKSYVDSVAQGLDVKESVRAATIAPVDFANELEDGDTIDGVLLSTGDRILVKNQGGTNLEKGIWIVQASGAPIRSSDFDTGDEVASSFTFVEEGTVQADTGWVVTNDQGSDIVDTDEIFWTQFSGAGAFTAGVGIDITGTVVSVLEDNSGSGESGLDVAVAGVRISTGAAGDGLTGGGGDALSVEPNTTDDNGEPGLEVAVNGVRISTSAAGDGLTGGGGDALEAATAIAAATGGQQYGGLVNDRTLDGTGVAATDAGHLAVQTDNVTLEISSSNELQIREGSDLDLFQGVFAYAAQMPSLGEQQAALVSVNHWAFFKKGASDSTFHVFRHSVANAGGTFPDADFSCVEMSTG